MININFLIEKLSIDFNIKIIQIVSGDEYHLSNGDVYANRSYIIGNDIIQLGIYDDINLKLISLFHEIGHIIVSNNHSYEEILNFSEFEIEKLAWDYGYKEAELYNIQFSKESKEWALKQLNTYLD